MAPDSPEFSGAPGAGWTHRNPGGFQVATDRFPPKYVQSFQCAAATSLAGPAPLFLTLAKTSLAFTEGIFHVSMSPNPPVGRFSGDRYWPVLGDVLGWNTT